MTRSTPRSGTTWSPRPLGEAIERRFADDTVRGVVATDALIGTFASLHDPSLVQNRCFLYHLIGNGTGEWRVPGRRHGRGHRARWRRPPPTPAPRSSPRPACPPSTAGDDGRRGHLARRPAHPHRHRPPRAGQRRAVGAADPDGRGRGRRDQAAGRPAQDQPAARPAPAAEVGRRPARRVRRHPPPREDYSQPRARRTPRPPPAGSRRPCRARSTATPSPTPRSSATPPTACTP